MDKLLYVAMSGAKSVMTRQAINNHNLANINTTGFREDMDATVSFSPPGKGLPTRVYADVHQNGVNAATGQVVNTGRELDIAIQGEGLIAVMGKNGTEEYTRAGSLRVSPNGLLETIDGAAVMGNNGPISVSPYQSLEISEDGTVSITPLGDTSGTVVVLDRIKLVNPDAQDLQKNPNGTLGLAPQLVRKATLTAAEGVTDNTLTTQNQQNLPADGTVGLISGALETSNVNSANSLITMVELSRNFEMQMKLMKTAEENDVAINRILN